MLHSRQSSRMFLRRGWAFAWCVASSLFGLQLSAADASVKGFEPGGVDLSVLVSFSDREPLVGDLATLDVDLINVGASTATGIIVDVLLPEGLTLDPVFVGLGSYVAATGVWTVPSLPASTSTSLVFEGILMPAADDPSGSGAPVGDGIFATIGGGFLFDMAFLPNGQSWVTKDSSIDQIVHLDVDGTVLSSVSVGTDGPRNIAVGPDGSLFVAMASDEVRRYDATSGALLGSFVGVGSGGLDNPLGLAFEEDGSLLVASGGTGQVLRYGTDGSFLGVVIAASSGGLGELKGMTIGPQGDLYLSSQATGNLKVVRYELPSGNVVGPMVAFESNLLPFAMEFGPDGSLFLGMMNPQTQQASLHRYGGPEASDVTDRLGVYVDVFPLGAPRGVALGPDGDVFTSGFLTGNVHRFRGFLTAEARLAFSNEVDPNPLDDSDRDALDFRRLDFGDAPAPFPTTLADDGARHGVPASGAWVFLGSAEPDTEVDGQPDSGAAGDGADEEAVNWLDDLVRGQVVGVEVSAEGESGLLDAWVDFDGDGIWSAGEQIAQSMPLPPSGTTTVDVMVPADAEFGPHLARFRISREGGLSPTGFARDGEVEDHVTTPVVPHADLGIAASATPNPVGGGGALTLVVDVSNTGPAIAADTAVELSWEGTQPISTSGCAEDPMGFPTCTLGDVAVGSPRQVTYTLSVIVVGPLLGGEDEVSHFVSLNSMTRDLDLGNNSASVTTPIDTEEPIVEGRTAILDDGSSKFLGECTTVQERFETIAVFFSEALRDPPGDEEEVDVTNPQSWRWVSPGEDGVLEPSTCDTLLGDDEWFVPVSVSWNPDSFQAVLHGVPAQRSSRYRLLACSAGLADSVGLALDGDRDGSPGGDNAIHFRVDHGNLFGNGSFDCDLRSWLNPTLGGAQIEHGSLDRDDDPGSGSAHFQGFEGGEELMMEQCLHYPEAQSLDWSMAARLDFASGGVLDMIFGCFFFENGGCQGPTLGVEQSPFEVELFEWTGLSGQIAVPAGGHSALCWVATDPGESQFYGLFLDSLRLEMLHLFADGFESGDTSRWTTTVE